MTLAAFELQKAVFAALAGNAELVGALGGPKLHDLTPANIRFPYITFGRSSFYDWSTSTEEGSEHFFTLHVWSKGKGKQEVQALMGHAEATLHGAELAVAGFHLVSLRRETAEVRFDEDLAVHHGLQHFRAVLEPV